jgi:hypothetical protein
MLSRDSEGLERRAGRRVGGIDSVVQSTLLYDLEDDSSSMGIPRGRLATPITSRTDAFSMPKTIFLQPALRTARL